MSDKFYNYPNFENFKSVFLYRLILLPLQEYGFCIILYVIPMYTFELYIACIFIHCVLQCILRGEYIVLCIYSKM